MTPGKRARKIVEVATAYYADYFNNDDVALSVAHSRLGDYISQALRADEEAARLEEREACARIVEFFQIPENRPSPVKGKLGEVLREAITGSIKMTAKHVAAAIRARGNGHVPGHRGYLSD